jgi:hypothetical protein
MRTTISSNARKDPDVKIVKCHGIVVKFTTEAAAFSAGVSCHSDPPTLRLRRTNATSLDPHIMSRFTGSEHWYRHGLVPSITFTDGAKYGADAAGAYWLLDEIAPAVRQESCAEEFQVWKLAGTPLFAQPVAVAANGNDVAVLEQAVEDRSGHDGVAEHAAMPQ